MLGINSNITKVENMIPVASEITIGIKNCACIEVSRSIGNRPKLVVIVVSNIGRNRRLIAAIVLSYMLL